MTYEYYHNKFGNFLNSDLPDFPDGYKGSTYAIYLKDNKEEYFSIDRVTKHEDLEKDLTYIRVYTKVSKLSSNGASATDTYKTEYYE